MPDLSIEIAGVRFPNPLIVASCSFTARADQIEALASAGAGGIITKTISPVAPNIFRGFQAARYEGGWTCSADRRVTMKEAEALFKHTRKSVSVPIIANVIGRSDDPESWADTCYRLQEAGADMIELDLNGHPDAPSPTIPADLGFFDNFSIGQDPEATARVVEAIKAACRIPVISKMTLRAPSPLSVAKSSVAAGADCISGMNALMGIAALDIAEGRSCLDGNELFQSGPILGPELAAYGRKWTALICKALDAPYMSGSGVMTVRDAIERIELGATAIQVCSAIYYEGPKLLGRWLEEIGRFLDEAGYASIADIRGMGLKRYVERGSSEYRPVQPQIIDRVKWEIVGEDVYDRVFLGCACIRRDGGTVTFDNAVCTGCALPSFHAPDAVAMVRR